MITLTEFIKENIWCTAGQDKQLTMVPGPMRFPGPDGISVTPSVTSFFEFMNDQIPTPTKSDPWYIYALGTDYAGANDLLQYYQKKWQLQKWQPFSLAVTKENVFVKVFTKNGIQFPLFETYYMFTNRRALLVAVRQPRLTSDGSPRIPFNQAADDVYVKFYKNSFYQSDRSHVADVDWNLKSDGKVLVSPNELTTIKNTASALTQHRGYTFLYINGSRWFNPATSDVSAGDVVEYVYDPTITHVETIFTDTLKTYESTIDGKTKLLLHLTKRNFSSIQYWDDLEIDLFKPIRSGTMIGVQFPILGDEVLRQVTDKDYGLAKDAFDTLKANLLSRINNITTPSPVLEVKTRHSGYDRPIVGTTARLGALYSLSDDQQLDLMTTLPSVYADWNADNLERSNYPRAMGEDYATITPLAAENMLGYWGLATSIYRNQRFLTLYESSHTAEINDTFLPTYTILPYTSDGQMVQSQVETTNVYTPTPLGAYSFLELFPGVGTLQPPVKMGDSNVPYTAGYGFRVYSCAKPGGVPDYVWTDITDTSDYVVDGLLHTVSFSSGAPPGNYLMVRDNSGFLLHSDDTLPIAGVARFTLREVVDRNQGDGLQSYLLGVKSGMLMTWVNTSPMIEGIDYFLQFPNIFIWNYNLIAAPDGVPFNYRYGVYGSGDGSGDFDQPVAKGFIKHGLVGGDNSYFFKSDRLLRVVIGNELRYFPTVKFSQDYPQQLQPTNLDNGLAYEAYEYVNDLTGITPSNWKTLYANSKVLDVSLKALIEGYRDPPVRGTSLNQNTYILACPFYSKLIEDLVTNVVPPPVYDFGVTDADIMTYMTGYMYLLDASPCNVANGVTTSGYTLRPHLHVDPVTITDDKYAMLLRVVDLYTPGVISMVGYVDHIPVPAPPTVVGFSHTFAPTTTGPFTVDVPAGTAIDDLLLLCLAGDLALPMTDFVLDAGWTLCTAGASIAELSADYIGSVWQKVITGPADQTVANVTASQDVRSASMIALRGANPILSGIALSSSPSAVSVGPLSLPAAVGSISVSFFVMGGGVYNDATGYTEDIIVTPDPTINVYGSTKDFVLAGTADPDPTSTVAGPIAAFHIVVNAAP